jgi:hypothetical protein
MQTARVLGGPTPGRPWTSPGYGLGLMQGEVDGGLTMCGHTGGGPGSVVAEVAVSGDAERSYGQKIWSLSRHCVRVRLHRIHTSRRGPRAAFWFRRLHGGAGRNTYAGLRHRAARSRRSSPTLYAVARLIANNSPPSSTMVKPRNPMPAETAAICAMSTKMPKNSSTANIHSN